MDGEEGNSNWALLIGAPIGGIILLIACCYCLYRCCCCCCRSNKQVVVVNTTNMVQPAREIPTVMVVNSMLPSGIEFCNPSYNQITEPLLPVETPAAGDLQLQKF